MGNTIYICIWKCLCATVIFTHIYVRHHKYFLHLNTKNSIIRYFLKSMRYLPIIVKTTVDFFNKYFCVLVMFIYMILLLFIYFKLTRRKIAIMLFILKKIYWSTIFWRYFLCFWILDTSWGGTLSVIVRISTTSWLSTQGRLKWRPKMIKEQNRVHLPTEIPWIQHRSFNDDGCLFILPHIGTYGFYNKCC